jgi:hypothetical protein
MATISWAAASSGLFQDSTMWAGGVVPGAASIAVLGARDGAAYTVTAESGLKGVPVGATQSVGSVNIASNATLEVVGFANANTGAAGTSGFNIISGGVNAGTILVENTTKPHTVNGVTTEIGGKAVLLAGGTLANSGSIMLDAQPNVTGVAAADQQAKLVANGALILNGGGSLTMSDEASNFIVGGTAPSSLVNVNNTISGAGSIGGNGLAITNQTNGVIDGDKSLPLILRTTSQITNQGRMEATKNGSLVIDSGSRTISNSGQIDALSGGKVTIASPVLNNRVLVAQTGGSLTVEGPVTGTGHVNISGGDIHTMSTFSQNVNFNVNTGGHLFLGDSADYTGTISGFSHTGISSVDLEDIRFNAKTTETLTQIAGGVELTVTNGAVTAHLDFAGTFAPNSFSLSRADDGSTLVMDPPSQPTPATSQTASRLTSAMAAMSPSHAVMTSAAMHPATSAAALTLATAHA